MRRHITKLFKCGICSFSCSDIDILQSHTYEKHACLECNRQFFCKLYHCCKKKKNFMIGGSNNPQPGSSSSSSPSLSPPVPVGFHKISSSFKDTLCVYKHEFLQDFAIISDAMDSIDKQLQSLVLTYVNLHNGIRLKLFLEMLFEDSKTLEQKIKSYPSAAFRIPHKTFINQGIKDCVTYLTSLCELLAQEISGLVLLKIINCRVVIMKYLPTQAKGKLGLGYLKRKRGILNSNVDQNCFHVSVVLCLHANNFILKNGKKFSETTKRERQKAKAFLESKKTGQQLCEKYPMRYSNLNYGKDLSLLNTFEQENNVAVSVYKFSKKYNAIITLRAPDKDYPRSCSLLMLSRSHLPKNEQLKYRNKYHFASIVNPNIFFNTKRKKALGFCNKCSTHYTNPSHLKTCMSGQNPEYKFSKKIEYRYTDLQKAIIPECTLYFQFLYANESYVKNVVKCKIIGFGLLGVDANYKELFSHFYVGNDSVEVFFDHMLLNASFYLDKMITSQLPLTATTEEREYMKTLKTCPMCNRDYDKAKNIIVVINHHHHDPEIPKTFICNQCNLKYYCLRKIFAFTFGLDICGKELLENISTTAIKHVQLIPKSETDSFLGIILKNKFILYGAENHLSETLYNSMDYADADDYEMLKNAEPEYCNILSNYLPFPHSSVHTVDDLRKNLPSKPDFFDISYPTLEQQKAYKTAKKYYQMLGCTSLHDYAIYHLKASTYGVACVMSSYSKFVYTHFKLHPLTDITISNYSYSALHYISQPNYHHLTDVKIYELLKENLIGGLSISAIKFVACQSPRLGDNVLPQDEIECISFDYNKQYNFLVGSLLPHSEYHLYSPEEVQNFKLDDISKNTDIHYFLCVDLSYPQSLKRMTAGLPLCPTKTKLFNEQTNKLFSLNEFSSNDKVMGMSKVSLDQHDKKGAWVSHQNLLLYLKLGMKLLNINQVISFRVKKSFENFTSACHTAFLQAKNKLHARIIKTCGNNCVGQLMSRGKSERVTICLDEKKATKLLAKSNFTNAISITEDMMCVSMLTKKTLLVKNLMMAFYILQESKRLLYEAYYCHFLPVFKNRLSCVLVETDGFTIRLLGGSENGNLYSDLKKLSHIVEFSRLPPDNPYYDSSRADVPGMIKIECINIRSIVSLRCKQFAIQTCNLQQCFTHKQIDCKKCLPASADIIKGIQKTRFTHDRFLKILNSLDSGVEEYTSISKKGGCIVVANKTRQFARVVGGDRIFISKYETVPLGYFEK